MASRAPAYLTLRNGIYYFQIRRPRAETSDKIIGQSLYRRSTGTGNRREALAIARIWWIDLMTKKDTGEGMPTDEEMDAAAQRDAELYSRGKALYQKLGKADPDDLLEIEDIIDGEFGSGKDRDYNTRALNHYQSRMEKRQTNSQNTLPGQVALDQKLADKRDIRLSKLLEKYVSHKSQGENAWTTKTRDKYAQQITIMIDMVGDVSAGELDTELLVEKYGIRLNLLPLRANNDPAYYNKMGERKPIEEIIELANKRQAKRISGQSVSDYIGRVQSFLKWGYRLGYFKEDLAFPLDHYKKKKFSKKESNWRLPFTDQDLKLLFETDHYKKGLYLHNKNFRHWVPLLGLYTGARLGEICQMSVENIKQDKTHGIWYIEFVHEGDNKRLKTASSERTVPIHPTLIELGFIDYINHLRAKKQSQVFIDLTPDKYGSWIRKATRWFGDYKEKCGVITESDNESKVFHSFRHTLINYGKQKRLDSGIMQEIVGHESRGSSSAHQGYQQEFEMKQKFDVLKKVKFDIDLSAIKKWQ